MYTYSLERNQKRDRSLDPIEDFVQNHRRGHCEYFASALTLMLKSQGIPARMVVGYMGGDLNTVGDYYIVRQLHAHAWVEAYMSTEQIPPDELESNEELPLGAWLRLDPTPSGVGMLADTDRWPLVTTLREFVDYCQVLWDDYILGLNSTRQRQAIYRPLMRNLRALKASLFDPAVWRRRWQNGLAWLQRLRSGRWSAWLLFAGVLATAVGLVILRRPMRRGLAAIHARRRREDQRARALRVPFYERLERVLAHRGFHRRPQETPCEFARATSHRLAQSTPSANAAEVPPRVADAYYRVRYGKQTLNEEEQEQIKRALVHLEHALRNDGSPSTTTQPQTRTRHVSHP
jgi:hypothetical protein